MASSSGKTSSASKKTKSTSTKTAAKKTAAKKTAASASASNEATKKAPAKKAAKKKAPAKKAAAENASSAAKKATAKKAAAKTAPAKKAAAKSAASKPSDEKKSQKPTLPSYLTNKDWLKSQRELLLQERLKYTHSAASLVAEAQALMADRDPGDVQFDEESGEGDTLAVERDRDLALSGKALENVAEIDSALERLAKGTYGICINSGDFIPQDRLEAIPWASKTVAAQTAMF